MFSSPITSRACLVPSKVSGADGTTPTNHTTRTMINEANLWAVRRGQGEPQEGMDLGRI